MNQRIALFATACAFAAPASPASAAIEPFPGCEVIDESGPARLVLRQLYDGSGVPDKFSLAYEEKAPPRAAEGGSPAAVRIFLLGRGAIDPAMLPDLLDKQGVFELRLYPAKPLDKPAVLSVTRGALADLDGGLGLARLVLPEEAQRAPFLSAIETYKHWRSYADRDSQLTWVLSGTERYGQVQDWGTVPLEAFDKARTALLAYAGQFVGKDVRTMTVAFKPGRACN